MKPTHTSVPSLDEVLSLLRPVIRRSGFGNDSVHKRRRIIADLGLNIDDYTPISQPLVPPLIDQYVLMDLPGAHGYVFPELLGSYMVPALLHHWGITAEQAFAAAHRNMAEAVPIDIPAGTGEPELIDLTGAPESFAGSFPMLDGWYEQVCRTSGPDTLMFMPAEGSLLLGRNMIGRETRFWREIRQRHEKAERPLSPLPYLVDRGQLVPYQPSFDAFEYPSLEEAAARLTMQSYQDQAARLRDLRQDGAHEFVVADVLAGLRSDGRGFTAAPWINDSVLMPVVDEVIVNEPGGHADQTFSVPLDLVAAIMQPQPIPNMNPPRYLLGPHPDEAGMARLRRVATMH